MATVEQYWDLFEEALEEGDDDLATEIRAEIESLLQEQNAPASPFLVGIGSGMTRVGQDIYGLGVGVGELTGIADEGAFTDYRDEVNRERALMDPLKEDEWTATAGEIVGEIAGAAPFGGFTGATAKQIPNFFGRTAVNIGIGAGQGALGSDDPVEGALWGTGGSVLGESVGEVARIVGKGEMPNIPHLMEDVPVMRADDMSSVYGTIERGAEMLPSGRNAVVTARQKQQEELKTATSRLIDEYDAGLGTSEVSESFNRRMKQRKAAAGRKYDTVGEQMEGKYPGSEWKQEIADTVDQLKADPEELQDKALIARLENYIRGNEEMTWTELRRLRSLVGRDVRDAYSGGKLVGTTDAPPLLEAKRSVTGALDTSAADVSPDWKNADEFYRDEVIKPYASSPSIVKGIMNSESPEQMVDKILRIGDKPTLVDSVLRSLDAPGRSALRTEMLRRAFPETVEGNISPAKASAFLNKHKELFERILPGENIGELAAFLKHIERAGQAGFIPQTGMGAEFAKGTLPPSLMIGGVGGGALAGGSDLATTGGVVTAAFVMQMLTGRIMAAAATGQPGEIGKVIKWFGNNFAEPTGRLVGSEIGTDE